MADRNELAGPNFVAGRGIRTLTVRQPWAWAILHGGKDVENRSRGTNIRGRIALHAAVARPGAQDRELMAGEAGLRVPSDLPLGAVLGFVDLVDCVRGSASKWADDDAWNWVLANPRAFDEPQPAKGALGFWFWMPSP